MTTTPQIITDKATAMIGDAKLFGSVYYADNIATFKSKGGRVKLKRPLKHIVRTLQLRLQKDKECTIIGAHGDAWSNFRFHKIVSYSLGVNTAGKWTITFSLGKVSDDNA